jgi:catechol 2,3-dioxygenase-like lactoylglutathione lyase family enzyme
MVDGEETLDFYTEWLGSQFIRNSVHNGFPDTLVGLTDATGEHEFMTYDDGYCILRGG